MTKWRRFEVMLPLQFNDGRSVPRAWIGEAMFEVGDHFGNVSFETQTIMGIWRQGAITYQDIFGKKHETEAVYSYQVPSSSLINQPRYNRYT